MFETCSPFELNVGDYCISGVTGGDGPALLLLHGYPQTHAMWHKLVPSLLPHFTIVAADLTGYGASGKPSTDANHTPYSKRAMATDMLNVMAQLGHATFCVAGHDRGARVAHRLAVDHTKAVLRVAVLDIAPTREMYANVSDQFARAYWHWYFLIQPAPFPENLILSNTDAYLEYKCGLWSGDMSIFSHDAMNAYKKAFRNPDTVHATCEDYRAAATIDIEHDDEDDRTGRTLRCPLLVLWGEDGVVERCFKPLELWQQRAKNVQGHAMPGGHFLAEQHPALIAEEFIRFFGDTQ